MLTSEHEGTIAGLRFRLAELERDVRAEIDRTFTWDEDTAEGVVSWADATLVERILAIIERDSHD